LLFSLQLLLGYTKFENGDVDSERLVAKVQLTKSLDTIGADY